MSDVGLTRLEVAQDLDQRRVTTTAAAQLLGSSGVGRMSKAPPDPSLCDLQLTPYVAQNTAN
jgi:hypothetical protein